MCCNNFTTEPGVARRLVPFFCFAKRKEPKKRRPDAAPLRGSQHFGKVSGHENNSAGGGGFYFMEASARQPQTIFVETPDPFPKCWRGNTGILECGGLCKWRLLKNYTLEKSLPLPRRREPNSATSRKPQKQEGPVRVAEQRSERRRFRRGLSELCAAIDRKSVV